MTLHDQYVEMMDWLGYECMLVGRALINENPQLAIEHQWGILVHYFGEDKAKELNDRIQWKIAHGYKLSLNLLCCKICCTPDLFEKQLLVATILGEMRRQVEFPMRARNERGMSLADL